MLAEAQSAHPTGILPFQTLRALVRDGEISAVTEIASDQIQPASIDLRLGEIAWRVPASFLPGADATVESRIRQLGGYEIDLGKGAVLERGCVYIVPLQERLDLSPRHSALANPKSSTGRLDVFTRVITDRGIEFDRVERGYRGPLYAEIAPRTFSILVRPGSKLSQLRVRRGTPGVSGGALKRLQEQMRLVDDDTAAMREDSIGVTIDLRGDRPDGLVGFRAKKHTDVIDVDLRAHYDPLDFWEPIFHRPGRPVILNPDDFYILATREAISVPPDHAAEMVAYDTLVGEFRVHYAGFFDPGFGFGPGQVSRAVLEVRSHEVPFVLEHGQVVGWLRYERLTAVPDKLYGPSIGSHYQRQGLQLGKQFKEPVL
ncbi:MAG: 2'-deoxycytidine 5'-triphosphate deaminase [Rhodospirillales bacterium]|nr:2'-deoxycytidine 5'-triphosphate deaminase [Rhodospirillales bacterium]